MQPTPVIAIFDVGKTNKKLFLFDEAYNIVFERTARFTETVDEDGDACENLQSLKLSVFDSMKEVMLLKHFKIKAVNFSAYGASFVYIDEEGNPLAPLYNYLKPFPELLKEQFYNTYGGEESFSFRTASPVLGNLNSGMQLYRIKYQKPDLFRKIKYALHLPQYMSYILSGVACSDITSVGCHTNLWDFSKGGYHDWVYAEGIDKKLAPLYPSDDVVWTSFSRNNYKIGIGLHDSSAALIPYLVSFSEPFVLISTGTWCISLNPFNSSPLTAEELKKDCLCYITYKGNPVKASRLFAGNEHEQQVKRIADYFHQSPLRYRSMEYNREIISILKNKSKCNTSETSSESILAPSIFANRDLSIFTNDEEAYHQLILDIIQQQYAATSMIINGTIVKHIFVDGGFSKNAIYMNLLAAVFPQMEVFAASMSQATALGTALSIHNKWNEKSLPGNIIQLKSYSLTHDAII